MTDHADIWQEIEWVDGTPAPEIGYPAIAQMAETKIMGYYLPSGPTWIEDPTTTLGYDMADCWASCMIPFDWGPSIRPSRLSVHFRDGHRRLCGTNG